MFKFEDLKVNSCDDRQTEWQPKCLALAHAYKVYMRRDQLFFWFEIPLIKRLICNFFNNVLVFLLLAFSSPLSFRHTPMTHQRLDYSKTIGSIRGISLRGRASPLWRERSQVQKTKIRLFIGRNLLEHETSLEYCREYRSSFLCSPYKQTTFTWCLPGRTWPAEWPAVSPNPPLTNYRTSLGRVWAARRLEEWINCWTP